MITKTESVTVQMNEILETVSRRVKGVFETASLEVAKETVQRLRNTSPEKSGDYARGWKVSKKERADLVVHNATDYQLTHLLENGHVVANQFGNYGHPDGRVAGIKHIKPAEEFASDELPRKIMEDLEL